MVEGFDMNKLFVFLGVLFSYAVGAFYGLPAITQTLLILIVMDMLIGFSIAWKEKKVSSHAAFKGAMRKTAQLVLIYMAGLLEPLIKLDIQLANVLAAYYVYVECLSILEHASKTGIPIPAFLKDALIRLNPDTRIVRIEPGAKENSEAEKK